MASIALEVQKAIIEQLKADAAVSALIGAAVYDRVEAAAKTPYVKYGETVMRPADGVDLRAFDISLVLHAWSTKPGAVEARHVADAVVEALHQKPINLVENLMVDMTWRQTRDFTDLDGLSTHAVIEFSVSAQRS